MDLGALGWHAVAVGSGAAAYVAASRGWLGWRVRGALRPALLAAGVGLFGGAALRFTIASVRADGPIAFMVAGSVIILGAVAVSRTFRTRCRE